jgi:hypothetical protein
MRRSCLVLLDAYALQAGTDRGAMSRHVSGFPVMSRGYANPNAGSFTPPMRSS